MMCADLGRLDPEAIAQVRTEAWPVVRDAEELHDALLSAGAMPESECRVWHEYFAVLETQGRTIQREVIGGPSLWMAAERWPAIHVAVTLADQEPPTTLPESLRTEVTKDDARMLLVRGRLEVVGPTTASRIATDIGMASADVQIALEQLELAGFLLRGRFTNESDEVEWCERRSLARIHRLTLDGLRRQVAPIDAAGFMRFLLAHHEISGDTRPTGVGGLQRIVAMLEGFETSACAWEHDLLSARMKYEDDRLDRLFASGEVVWGRIEPPPRTEDRRGQILTRVSPISLVRRSDLAWLLPAERKTFVGSARWDAQAVYEALASHGALFFNDLLSVTSLLPSQLEEALRELAALGLVTSDGFTAVRAVCSKTKHTIGRRSRRRGAAHRVGVYSKGGRWSKFPPFVQSVEAGERAEKWAWLLLRRYGVMFRDLLARESLAPTWGELARVYRRLEMRGEVRGGRFVSGVAGEQFAVPEAVDQLRKLRDEPEKESWAVISAVDPLNLVGVVTHDVRVPALRSNRIVFRNGQPIAAREARRIRWMADMEDAVRWRAERLLSAPGMLGREREMIRVANDDQPIDSLAGIAQ